MSYTIAAGGEKPSVVYRPSLWAWLAVSAWLLFWVLVPAADLLRDSISQLALPVLVVGLVGTAAGVVLLSIRETLVRESELIVQEFSLLGRSVRRRESPFSGEPFAVCEPPGFFSLRDTSPFISFGDSGLKSGAGFVSRSQASDLAQVLNSLAGGREPSRAI